MPAARAVHSYYTGLSHRAGIHFHPYCEEWLVGKAITTKQLRNWTGPFAPTANGP
jgi:truncated hemoglobin YjbI